MTKRYVWVGVLVCVAILVFGSCLFLIGNQHRAFRRHMSYFAEFANVDGVFEGAKVRVNGLDAGEVKELIIPSSPAHKFRLKLTVEERASGLVRSDSVVTVETEGVVGDKFILIGHGTDRSAVAPQESTLPSKEPFEIARMMEQASGLLVQFNGTLTDVQTKLDGTLAAVTSTVNNTNAVVTDIRQGKGTAGVLLEDQRTAKDVRQIVQNARQATEHLNEASIQVHEVIQNVSGIVQDADQRHLVAKVDDTLNSARHTMGQLDQVSQKVNTTLKTALAQDQYGRDAGENLQQSLANIDDATGNLADDTEALKHEFFFKGFFKKRGYDNLNQLPIVPYREGKLIKQSVQSRQWVAAGTLFEKQPDGSETLSAIGRAQIDQAVSQMPDLYSGIIIVEGYSAAADTGKNLVLSRQRASTVRTYLKLEYYVASRKTGIIGLSATPPVASGRTIWDGICLVHMASGG